MSNYEITIDGVPQQDVYATVQEADTVAAGMRLNNGANKNIIVREREPAPVAEQGTPGNPAGADQRAVTAGTVSETEAPEATPTAPALPGTRPSSRPSSFPKR